MEQTLNQLLSTLGHIHAELRERNAIESLKADYLSAICDELARSAETLDNINFEATRANELREITNTNLERIWKEMP